ncbi:MAG: ATP-binding protein [Chloroflexota bacterium]
MASETSQLSLNLLGPPEVRLGGRLLAFPTRKALALLIYLTLEKGPQPRQHLATLLWPESSPERSLASLRNDLNRLQAALRQADDSSPPFSYLSITHDTLASNPDAGILLDLHTVARAYLLARSDRSSRIPPNGSASLPLLLSAADCQRGDFLVGFSLSNAPEFDDWVAIQREVWRRRLGLILDRLSEIQFANGEFVRATETDAQWIALDALNEVAYRHKMRTHFAAGERSLALETYEACRAVLAAELGVEPEPDTEALATLIRSQHLHPRPSHRSDTPVAFLESRFAGRTCEYQTLIEHYERAAAGQPQVFILRGEAGIGKTRLATEFLTWAGTQGGAKVLQGDAFESSHHMPFQPLLDALRLWIKHERMDSFGVASFKSPQNWPAEAWLAPLNQLLPELRQHYPDLPSIPLEHMPLKTGKGQTRFFEPFVRFTLALARESPLVLFVDDLQWADRATLDLLHYAIRRWLQNATRADGDTRVLLLVSLRAEALHPMAHILPTNATRETSFWGISEWLAQITREFQPAQQDLSHPASLCHLELKPLDEQDTTQMVNVILSPPATDFAQWIFDETRGQPFYLMETLKDLLERRVLHPKRQATGQAKTGWFFTVDAEHDLGKTVRVPSTVRAVIRSRLDRLSPNAFGLLAAGAILEQHITFEHLCAVSNTTEDLALPALDELVSSRLLLEVAQPESASIYVFANDMIRDVVYTEAGDARRRLFHRRAIDSLEAVKASPAVLAHHALAAGLAEAAFRHCLSAAHEALRLSAAGEAIIHFEQALQLVQEGLSPGPSDKAKIRELYLQLSQAYELSDQSEQAVRISEALEQIAKNVEK